MSERQKPHSVHDDAEFLRPILMAVERDWGNEGCLAALDNLIEQLEASQHALDSLLDRYVSLVASGDCGHWYVDKEPEVIAARAVLSNPASVPNTGTKP